MRNLKMSAPWCWIAKVALQRIREATDGTETGASRIAVYVALCELASDEGHEKGFVATRPKIASYAGLHPKTVERATPDLVRAGVITIAVPPWAAPGSKLRYYTLVHFGQKDRSNGHKDGSSRHNDGTIRQAEAAACLNPYIEKKERKNEGESSDAGFKQKQHSCGFGREDCI